MCSNLVVIDTFTNTFKFGHPSIREFLLKRNVNAEAQAHARVLHDCISSLRDVSDRYDAGFPGQNTARFGASLEQYAATAWPIHCQHSKLASGPTITETWLREFLSLAPVHKSFLAWRAFVRDILQSCLIAPEALTGHSKEYSLTQRCISRHASPLYVSSIFGLQAVLRNTKVEDLVKPDPEGDDAICLASTYSDVAMLSMLLARGIPLSVGNTSHRRKSPLMLAVKYNELSVIQFLVSRGAEIDYKDACGETTLHIAAGQGKTAIFGYLIDQNAAIDNASVGSNTALSSAARGGHYAIAHELIARGANINHVGSYNSTILQDAVTGGSVDLVRQLLDLGAKWSAAEARDNDDFVGHETPLIASAYSGHLPIVKFLLSRGADVNETGGKYIHALLAAGYGQQGDVVQYLLEKGASLNGIDWSLHSGDYNGWSHWRLHRHKESLVSENKGIVYECLMQYDFRQAFTDKFAEWLTGESDWPAYL